MTNERIEELKTELLTAFNNLPEERRSEITHFYGTGPNGLVRMAKEAAQDTIDYADRKMYGYGEVGYNLNEEIKDFAEDTPELEKEFRVLAKAYFNMLVEVKEA